MGIFKKPRVLVIAGAVALAIIVLVLFLLPSQKPKTIGLYAFDSSSKHSTLLEKQLQKAGYTLTYTNTLEDLQSTDCVAWLVRADSDETARQIADAVGDKAIFVGRKPNWEGTFRFVGWDMEQAGGLLAELIPFLPRGGDSNEDGIVSCLILTGDAPLWQQGLEAGFALSQQSIDVLQTLSCDLSVEAAHSAVTEALAQYGRDIEVILASDELLATGAAKAISGRGWIQGEDFYLLSTGQTESALAALNEALRSGLAFSREEEFANLLSTAVLDAVNGKAPKEYLASFIKMSSAVPLN